MKTVHNERLKITATFLNGLAIANFAIGGLSPAIQAMRVMTLPPQLLSGTLVVVVVCAGGGRCTTLGCEDVALLLAMPFAGLVLGLAFFAIARRGAQHAASHPTPGSRQTLMPLLRPRFGAAEP